MATNVLEDAELQDLARQLERRCAKAFRLYRWHMQSADPLSFAEYATCFHSIPLEVVEAWQTQRDIEPVLKQILK
jgi:hypothetical protein